MVRWRGQFSSTSCCLIVKLSKVKRKSLCFPQCTQSDMEKIGGIGLFEKLKFDLLYFKTHYCHLLSILIKIIFLKT